MLHVKQSVNVPPLIVFPNVRWISNGKTSILIYRITAFFQHKHLPPAWQPNASSPSPWRRPSSSPSSRHAWDGPNGWLSTALSRSQPSQFPDVADKFKSPVNGQHGRPKSAPINNRWPVECRCGPPWSPQYLPDQPGGRCRRNKQN